MKKYLFALIIQAIISVSLVSAQTDHMIFRNVPIDGSLVSFVQKMKNQGFILAYENDTFASMEGKFVDRDCELYIVATPKTYKVWKVVVRLAEDNSWQSLKSDYLRYKKEFRKKYGKKIESFEFFEWPYYDRDGYELDAIKKNKCTYSSYIHTPYGTIIVRIAKSSPAIEFVYEDGINNKLKNRETKDDIQDEI